MFFFLSQYVVNEGADNKLNSMESVLVDIEKCGDYVMSPSAHRYGLFETRPT